MPDAGLTQFQRDRCSRRRWVVAVIEVGPVARASEGRPGGKRRQGRPSSATILVIPCLENVMRDETFSWLHIKARRRAPLRPSAREGRPLEGFAERAVQILTRLRSPNLKEAQATLTACRR